MPQPAPLALVQLDSVSPSSLETFADCQRKWAWHKLDGIPKPQGAGAELGERVHGQQERWLKFGIPYDMTTREGEIAMASFHLVPEPGTCAVEETFTVTYDGIRFGGKFDFKPRPEFCPPGVVVIGDHKTTASLGWAKLTKAELMGHPQAPIYALHGLTEAWEQGRPAEWVELRWNYATTRGKPKAEPSWHRVHASELPAAMAEPVRLARQMLAVVETCNAERAAGRPFGALNLPPSPASCGKFGGCPYQSNCKLSPKESVIAMTQNAQTMTSAEFLARIGARRDPAQPAAAPVPPAPPPVQGAPAPGFFVPGMQMPAAPPAAPVQAPQGPMGWAGPPAQMHPMAASYPFPGYGGQVVPPEAAVPVPQAQPAPAVPEAPTEPAKKKGGRPKKAPVAPTTVVNVAAPLASVDAPQGTNLPPPVSAEEMSEYERERTLQAILQGLCANPAHAGLLPEQIAHRAQAVLVAVLGLS